MPRTFGADLRTGNVLRWGVTRGKCRYGPSHESVALAGEEWIGESSGTAECDFAPQDTCTTCDGRGFHELRGQAAEQAALEGHPAEMVGGELVARRPCPPCAGLGQVPGPHWPWRWPQPPPLRPKD